MAIVLQDTSGLAEGITGLGNILGDVLGQRRQQRTQEKQNQFLKSEIDRLGDSASPIDYLNFINRAIEAGIPPEQIKLYSDAIKPQLKEQAQVSAYRSILDETMGRKGGEMTAVSEESTEESAPIQSQQTQQNDLSEFTEEQLVKLGSSGNPIAQNAAKLEMTRRDAERRDFRSDRDFAYKRAGKFLEKIDEDRRSVRDQQEALQLMENALQEENLDFFSTDNFANFLGKYGEGLRTAKGAQLLTAMKEFLLADIGRAGSRPNQWIEQQIASALTRIGRSKEANMTVVEALKARVERNQKRIEVTDQIEKQYMDDIGYVPGNIGALVDQAMKPYEEKIANRLSYRIREQYENEQGKNLRKELTKKVAAGTPLTEKMALLFLNKYGNEEKALKNAEKLGYTIVSEEELESY